MTVYTTESESILDSAKNFIGVSDEDEDFDKAIIMAINAAFLTLRELKVGPKEGFRITSSAETFGDFMTGRIVDSIAMYTNIKAKLMVDPPASATILKALQDAAAELEFRFNSQEEYMYE